MAIITTRFDTDKKTLEVDIDGQALANIREVRFYPSWEKDSAYMADVLTREPETDGLTKVTHLMASEADPAPASQTLHQAIASYLARK